MGASSVTQRPWPKQAFNFAFFFFAYYAYLGAFTPYVSLYFASKGMDAAEIGILMSLMQITRIFGPTLWGWVADHSERRARVLRITAFAALTTFVGLFFGSTFMQFFVVMVLLNGCTSAQAPLSEALMLSEMHGDLTHYGRLRLWGSVGFIVAVTAGGKLLDQIGVAHMPWLAWGLLTLVLIASLRLRESPHAQEHREHPSVMKLLMRREVISFFSSTMMMVAAHSALYVFYSLYLAQIGYSKTVIGLMWSLGVIAEIVFFYFQAPIFRRFGVKPLMLISIALAVARFAVIGAFPQSLALLLFAQVLHAATFAAHHSSSVLTMQRWFSGPLQASGQALYFSISYGVGGSLGGMLLSMFWRDTDGHAVFYAAAIMAAIGFFAALLSFHWQNNISDTQKVSV
jgi:PPP family 3-phenylpropionic acid transporter